MNKSEVRRLIKIENRIHQIAQDELKLEYYPIEFDVCGAQRMLEIMAYNIPTNISNWKFGRNYERQKTIYEHTGHSLPYEVVIASNPARAFLMKENRFAVQCLVMAHVVGHVAFFSNNKYFRNSRLDIIHLMYEASKRFNQYERRYGIDEVEKTVDAGHALQLHSSPFESNKTEDEKRQRIFLQKKKEIYSHKGEFEDLTRTDKEEIKEDIELYNQRLWRNLKLKTPVEPTEDLLRYIIDNSKVLEDWQKDILEVLRIEGQYYWPLMKTKLANEGWATFVHQKIMNRLFQEGLLSKSEHADYNYSNSLVKAENNFSINPYLIGCAIWEDIEDRWNKGRYGDDWEHCTDSRLKEVWDTKENRGWEKCKEVIKTCTDWFFVHEYLTEEIIRDLNLYLYEEIDGLATIDYVITKHKAKEIKEKIVRYYASEIFPKVEITDGNHLGKGFLRLQHKYVGVPLDEMYAEKTLKHISYLWGNRAVLFTKDENDNVKILESHPLNEETEGSK